MLWSARVVALLAALVARLGVDEHWPMDHRVRAALAYHGRPKLRATLGAAGMSGSVGVYVPATLAVAALIARRNGDRSRSLPPIGAVAVAAVANLLLKRLVRRPRPRANSGAVNTSASWSSEIHRTRLRRPCRVE